VRAAFIAPHGKHPAPWTFTDAAWVQLTFEVSQAAALAALPGEVTRPVPCYARLFVLDAASSPVGPIRLAALLVGGRYRMMARIVFVDAIVDGPADDMAAAFGSPYRAGHVSLARDGSAVT